MNIFQKLFGRKRATETAAASANTAPARSETAAPPTDPFNDPNLIRVYDSYGREIFITRQQWRENVLGGTIRSAWDQPDELYGIIVSALNDGFRSEVVEAAEHLSKIDPLRTRGVCLWGVVLAEEGRLDEAEKLFSDFTATNGEDGLILTNLAKIHAKRNDHSRAERVLWHALEVDPNQDVGVAWYVAIQRERGGEVAADEALRRIAALPASWRAQLSLARHALTLSQPQRAIEYYEQSLSRAGSPVPAELLMQMSGDLGNHGHLSEIIRLAAPRFQVAAHGLQVGNNLIKAQLDLGQVQEAKRVLEALYAQQRPDWNETLQFWDREISQKVLAATPLPMDEPLPGAVLTIQGPVWFREDSPAAVLFRLPDKAAQLICFLGSSAESGKAAEPMQRQLPDAPGRMSRALPLFLAEQTQLHMQARARTLIPWIIAPRGGFVLAGKPWAESEAAGLAREGADPADYLVLTHLLTTDSPWVVRMRMIRTIDGTCLAEWEQALDAEHPEEAVQLLVSHLHAGLREHVDLLPRPSASLYQVPEGLWFSDYLLRLEQLLALRAASMEGVESGFLHGEREIIDGCLRLCVEYPQNVTTRLLLARALSALKAVRPEVVVEYRERISLLQRERRLPEPAHGVLQRILNDALV